MRVLIACEFSGRVRDAFIRNGHDAVSCDIRPSHAPGPHLQCDVREILGNGWDMMIAHPPCTDLAASGARWWREKWREQREALDFVRHLMFCDIPRKAIENPVGKISTEIRKPDQIVQPHWFGDGFVKTTCLWLEGLPLLVADDPVSGRVQEVWRMAPSDPDREWKRSLTYPGMARAFAQQWG